MNGNSVLNPVFDWKQVAYYLLLSRAMDDIEELVEEFADVPDIVEGAKTLAARYKPIVKKLEEMGGGA